MFGSTHPDGVADEGADERRQVAAGRFENVGRVEQDDVVAAQLLHQQQRQRQQERLQGPRLQQVGDADAARRPLRLDRIVEPLQFRLDDMDRPAQTSQSLARLLPPI